MQGMFRPSRPFSFTTHLRLHIVVKKGVYATEGPFSASIAISSVNRCEESMIEANNKSANDNDRHSLSEWNAKHFQQKIFLLSSRSFRPF